MVAKKVSSKQYPKDIQEFMKNGWDTQVRYRIRAFNLRDILNQQEELVQDIIVSLMETKYLDRYSLEKGPFTTYLYGFVDNFLKKRYNKENTRNGKKIVNSASIAISSPDSNTEFDGSVVYLDLVLPLSNKNIEFDKEILLEEIRKELEKFKANSSVEYNGEMLDRDALTVFNLIIKDYSVIEIAKMLKTSRQFIYHLLKKIRSLQIFKDIASKY